MNFWFKCIFLESVQISSRHELQKLENYFYLMFSSGSLDILLGHLKAIAELKNFYFGSFANNDAQLTYEEAPFHL